MLHPKNDPSRPICFSLILIKSVFFIKHLRNINYQTKLGCKNSFYNLLSLKWATLTNIAYEKGVALYLNGPEVWTEWRRLDMPVLKASGNARIPLGNAYDSSVEDNNTNYAAEVTAQEPANLHTKLWWDKN